MVNYRLISLALTRERGPSFASAGYDGSGLYGEGEKVVLCDV